MLEVLDRFFRSILDKTREGSRELMPSLHRRDDPANPAYEVNALFLKTTLIASTSKKGLKFSFGWHATGLQENIRILRITRVSDNHTFLDLYRQ